MYLNVFSTKDESTASFIHMRVLIKYNSLDKKIWFFNKLHWDKLIAAFT